MGGSLLAQPSSLENSSQGLPGSLTFDYGVAKLWLGLGHSDSACLKVVLGASCSNRRRDRLSTHWILSRCRWETIDELARLVYLRLWFWSLHRSSFGLVLGTAVSHASKLLVTVCSSWRAGKGVLDTSQSVWLGLPRVDGYLRNVGSCLLRSMLCDLSRPSDSFCHAESNPWQGKSTKEAIRDQKAHCFPDRSRKPLSGRTESQLLSCFGLESP